MLVHVGIRSSLPFLTTLLLLLFSSLKHISFKLVCQYYYYYYYCLTVESVVLALYLPV